MSLLVLLALSLVGIAVGFVSGLVGIGGGVLIVPFLYLFYGHPELSGILLRDDLHTVVAHATSLFVILPTAVAGARNFAKSHHVLWRVGLWVGVVAAVAAAIAARIALNLPEGAMRVAFGLFLLATSAQLAFSGKTIEGREHKTSISAIIGTGAVVGALSGLLGIGGGAIASPILVYYVGLNLRQATGTSLLIVGIAAIGGMLSYGVSGWGEAGMPAGSFGYVHILAGLPILIGSLISVKWGAQLNQRMHSSTLRKIFAAFFATLGSYIIAQASGLFS